MFTGLDYFDWRGEVTSEDDKLMKTVRQRIQTPALGSAAHCCCCGWRHSTKSLTRTRQQRVHQWERGTGSRAQAADQWGARSRVSCSVELPGDQDAQEERDESSHTATAIYHSLNYFKCGKTINHQRNIKVSDHFKSRGTQIQELDFNIEMKVIMLQVEYDM